MIMECENKQILQSCLKKLEKINKNVKIDDFWSDLPEILTMPWQRKISWTHG